MFCADEFNILGENVNARRKTTEVSQEKTLSRHHTARKNHDFMLSLLDL
jgi:hypothetical protein